MYTDDYGDTAALFGLDGACPSLEPNSTIHPRYFETTEPKVALLGITGRREVLLVQSSKKATAEEELSWLIPQGDIRQRESKYLALTNLAFKELGIQYSPKRLLEMEERYQLSWLGTYTNTVRKPADRAALPKHILVAAMPISNPARVRLNPLENVKGEWVSDQFALWNLLRHTRVVKQLAILHAVNDAYSIGLISWSCSEVIRQFSVTKEVVAA